MNAFFDKSRRRFLHSTAAASLAPGLIAGTVFPAFGQLAFQNPDEESPPLGGPRIGSGQTQIFKAGVKIRANGSSLDKATIAVPIPMDWGGEQKTKIVEEKTEPGVKLDYLKRPTAVPTSCMAVFSARKLNANRDLEMYVTVETERFETLPPPTEEAVKLIIPPKRLRQLKPFYSESPRIECDNGVFLKTFREITDPLKEASDWAKVEAIYDYVRDKIAYEDGVADKPAKGALKTLTDGKWKGDCKDMSFLFIALCRAGKIPARAVRMPTHCYAEFYLEEPSSPSAESKSDRKAAPPVGYWFPCQLAGDRAFGGVSDFNPILQKGDNFAELDDPKNKDYFVKEQFYAEHTNGTDPEFTHIHELKAK